MDRMYSRGRTGGQTAANQTRQSNGARLSRRSREEIGADEEGVARPSASKRRRQPGPSRQPSSSRTHRQEERVEENNRGDVDEDGDDEEEGIEVDDGDEDDEHDVDAADGGLWGVKPLKKAKVSAAAQKAAEQLGRDEIKRKANELARMALFSEHRRVVLKREDITKKILDKASAKAFPIVFNRAQKVLCYTFGYEMVELRAKGADDAQVTQAQAPGEQEEGEDSRPSASLSRTYIVRSVLPPKAIAAMAAPRTALSDLVNDVSQSVDGKPFDKEGVMIDWTRSTEGLGCMGLLFLILSFILLNGRSATDDQLRSYMRRMSLHPDRTLPTALQLSEGKEGGRGDTTLNDVLDVFLKQQYLECIRVGAAPQGAMSMEGASQAGRRMQVRGRRLKGDNGEGNGEEMEWRWGARAESEITEKAVAEFIADIYLDSEGDQDEDGDGMTNETDEQLSRRERQQKLIDQVTHAAGSQLIC